MLKFVQDKTIAAMTIMICDVEERVFASINAQQGKAVEEYKKSLSGQLLSMCERETYEITAKQREVEQTDRDGTPFLRDLRYLKGPTRLNRLRSARPPIGRSSSNRSNKSNRSASSKDQLLAAQELHGGLGCPSKSKRAVAHVRIQWRQSNQGIHQNQRNPIARARKMQNAADLLTKIKQRESFQNNASTARVVEAAQSCLHSVSSSQRAKEKAKGGEHRRFRSENSKCVAFISGDSGLVSRRPLRLYFAIETDCSQSFQIS